MKDSKAQMNDGEKMELTVVSFNLRCTWEHGDGVNCFIHRAAMILEKLRTEKPEVICFQEAIPRHIQFLRSYLTEYDFIYNQRNQDLSGEGLACAYKRGAFELYQHDTFWLSDNPYAPGSRFDGQSQCPRIAQNMVFKDLRTNTLFRVHNVHLDHVSDDARIKGIDVVLRYIEKAQKQWKLPVFLMGDFNAAADSETIYHCNHHSSLKLVDTTKQIPITWHDFGKNLSKENLQPYKIDYIFTDEETAGHSYTSGVWTDCRNGIFLSDHYPVYLKIRM